MKIIVGKGSCGIAAGANKVSEAIEKIIQEKHLNNIEVDLAGCIGMCYLEPIIDVITDDGQKTTYVKVTPEIVPEIIESHLEKKEAAAAYQISEQDAAILEKQKRIALRNCGIINPERIEEYIAKGGYEGLRKCLKEMTPEDVIEEIKISGLAGRGGAGFPTWFKWNAARNAKGDKKYVICNADEGDPGAFMDRSILEGDPHTLIEGMAIAAYAIGADEGAVYVRAEYPLAITRLSKAIEQARENGFLGKNILGTNFSFDLRIKAGAGA
ncbi:MAG TPA: NADH-quinone oxidoreductase subunit F, partial [Clostridiales bacterium]|nr:NADH-quinone oxidoreductase subunit F [Clostridiales bacterium]